MARKKGVATAAVVVKKQEKVKKEVNKSVESLYNQLNTLMKKNKVSKRDLAEKLDMSYQGFLNSYNNRNIRLEGWYDMAELLNKPFLARFESAKNIAALEAGASSSETEAPSAASSSPVSNDFTLMRLRNAEEKVAILEKQIAMLESQLVDKQTIIELIKK
jgi:chaperonin cofactor prefoldin